MAYKFQLGAFRASGSLTQEGGVTAEDSALSGSSLNVGTAVLSAAELEVLDGVSAGTATGDKALIVDSNKDIGTIRNLTIDGTFSDGNYTFDTSGNVTGLGSVSCGAITSTGTSTFAAGVTPAAANGAALGSAAKEWSDLFLHDGGIVYYGADQDVRLSHVADSGLLLESTNAGAANATMLKLQLSSSSPADNDEIGKLVFSGFNDANVNEETIYGQILAKSVDVSDGTEDGSIGINVIRAGTPVEFINIHGTTADTVTFVDGAFDVDIASHDGTNGLKLGGTLVTATAAQLNQLQTGAVTSVASLLKTDIKIGEDDQTKIDFEDTNKINFYANNAKELVLEENKLTPGTNDGIALGDSSLGFSDLYLADGSIAYFGNDQDVQLEHDADDGLKLRNVNAGAGRPARLILELSSSSPADNDLIGRIRMAGFNDNEQSVTYSQITSKATDVSDGSEDGGLQFQAMIAGTLTELMDISVTAAGETTMQEIVNLTDHDGSSKGLKLGDTLVTSTAAELNKLDGASADVTAAKLNTLCALTNAEVAFIDGVTAGTGSASKALVLNDLGIVRFNDGSVPDLFGASAHANQLRFGTDGNFAIYYDENQADGLVIAGLHNAEAGVNIIADEGDDASMTLVSDQGDDAGDSWRFGCADGGVLTIGNDIASQGTSVAHLTITPNATNIIQSTASFAGNVVVAGNFTVSGQTTTVNSTIVNITSSLIFEGPADAHETTFGIVDPTADATINLPAMSAGTYHVPVLAAASTTAISSTPAELNLLDGSAKSTSSITIADADGFLIIDGSTTKQIPASDLKTYIGNTSNLDVALKDDGDDLVVGVNYFANFAGAESVNLPASPSDGDAVYIKAPSNCSATNKLTVNRQGSHTIDGGNSIILESPDAAVMCVYVVANTWKVF